MIRNLCCIVVALSLTSSTAVAQRGDAVGKPSEPLRLLQTSNAAQGSTRRQIDPFEFETVVSERGLRVFVRDLKGKPVAVDRVRGFTSLRFAKKSKRYRYELLPDGNGGLIAPVKLSAGANRPVEATIRLFGVPGFEGQSISFREAISVPAGEVRLASNEMQTRIKVSSATQSDAKLIARQKVCPVMDEALGGMGTPVKVLLDDKPIFLCCKGCTKKVEEDPAKYFALVYGDIEASPAQSSRMSAEVVASEADQVRPGVYAVTASDALFVAAQKRCPVMDVPLDAMGGPYKVSADGKAVYICCPGCANSVREEPDEYLGILAEQGIEAPIFR